MAVSVTRGGTLGSGRRGRGRLRLNDRIGDRALRALCLAAAAVTVLVIVDVAYQLIHGSSLALSRFGLGFLTHGAWKPNFSQFGATTLLFGTAASSLMALVLAVPLAIAIGLYLALLAPGGVRGVAGSLVEMLAAIPSVILGFWGILVLSPFVSRHLEQWLHGGAGFLPIFGAPQTTGASIFTAGLILAIMVVPVVASISRDLFEAVPRELRDGAEALGATRWEVIRGVILPETASGIAAAVCLGLGRALGEAIAVTQVIGAGHHGVQATLFQTGDTLASRIANEFQGAFTKLHTASLFYLALVLLVFSLLTNLAAGWIGRRFDRRHTVASA
jgi:phosphate transport system permease protein